MCEREGRVQALWGQDEEQTRSKHRFLTQINPISKTYRGIRTAAVRGGRTLGSVGILMRDVDGVPSIRGIGSPPKPLMRCWMVARKLESKRWTRGEDDEGSGVAANPRVTRRPVLLMHGGCWDWKKGRVGRPVLLVASVLHLAAAPIGGGVMSAALPSSSGRSGSNPSKMVENAVLCVVNVLVCVLAE